MARRYYSSRNHPVSLTLVELYRKFQSLYFFFRSGDYFKQKAGISENDMEFPAAIRHEATIALSFQLFPIEKWHKDEIVEDNILMPLSFYLIMFLNQVN
jgi:hypothetical protein